MWAAAGNARFYVGCAPIIDCASGFLGKTCPWACLVNPNITLILNPCTASQHQDRRSMNAATAAGTPVNAGNARFYEPVALKFKIDRGF